MPKLTRFHIVAVFALITGAVLFAAVKSAPVAEARSVVDKGIISPDPLSRRIQDPAALKVTGR